MLSKIYFIWLASWLLLFAPWSDVIAEPPPEKKIIHFAGRMWEVSHSAEKRGPGPNYFDSRNAWVDEDGKLHLKISRDPTSGRWNCAEVASTDSMGLGRYLFWVEGDLDALDPNVVLGLFNYSGHDGFDEMDIEIARWGNPKWDNLNFTTYPAYEDRKTGAKSESATSSVRFDTTQTTHQFTRRGDSVRYQSSQGFVDDDSKWLASVTMGPPLTSVSQRKMPILMNLWLFKGRAIEKPVEIVITAFRYTPNE